MNISLDSNLSYPYKIYRKRFTRYVFFHQNLVGGTVLWTLREINSVRFCKTLLGLFRGKIILGLTNDPCNCKEWRDTKYSEEKPRKYAKGKELNVETNAWKN